MSFDATRQVWALRRARRLPGGTVLLVMLALADRADKASGEVKTSGRQLGRDVGIHHAQALRALAWARDEAVIEVVEYRRRHPPIGLPVPCG